MKHYWCKCSFRGLAVWLVSVRKRHCRHTQLKNVYCNPLSLERLLIRGTSNKKKSKKDTEKKLEHLKAQTLEIQKLREKKARTLQCTSGSSKHYLKASQPEGGFPSENSKC